MIGVEAWLFNKTKYRNHVVTIVVHMMVWLPPIRMSAAIVANRSARIMFAQLVDTMVTVRLCLWPAILIWTKTPPNPVWAV